MASQSILPIYERLMAHCEEAAEIADSCYSVNIKQLFFEDVEKYYQNGKCLAETAA